MENGKANTNLLLFLPFLSPFSSSDSLPFLPRFFLRGASSSSLYSDRISPSSVVLFDLCKQQSKGSSLCSAVSSHFLPSLTDLFIPTPTRLLLEAFSHAAIMRNDYSLTFPPLSIARYSFIQQSEQGRQWREQKCPNIETVAKGDSNQGSLDCESVVLPLSYRAPTTIGAD